MTEQIANFGHTTVNEALDASETTVTVTDGSVFPASGNFRVKVDSELMLVTSRSSNDLTVERGAEGTTAVGHDNGADIDAVLSAGGIVTMIDERSAVALVGAQATKSADQTNLTGGAVTQLTWDGTNWDSDGFFGDANDEFVVPAGLGGRYALSGMVYHDATSGLSNIQGLIYVNDSSIGHIYRETSPGADHAVPFYLELELGAGDTVDVRVAVTGTSTSDILSTANGGTLFSIRKLGSGSVGQYIGAQMSLDSNQTNIGTGATVVDWDNVDWDTDGFADIVTDNDFTIPTGMAGKYLVAGVIHLDETGSVTDLQVILDVTGDAITVEHDRSPTADRGFSFAVVLDLVAGDTLHLDIYNTGSSAVDVRATASRMSITLLSAPGHIPIKHALWLPPGNEQSPSDEFDDGSLHADWTRVDSAGESTHLTWTEGIRKGLNVQHQGTDATAEFHALVRSIDSLGSPLGISISFDHHFEDLNYSMLGLVFADGNTVAAGNQAILVPQAGSAATTGPVLRDIDNWNSNAASVHSGPVFNFDGLPVHWRLRWESANTFGYDVSSDGVNWRQLATGQSITVTPTHIGVVYSSYGGAGEADALLHYFRVHDLS